MDIAIEDSTLRQALYMIGAVGRHQHFGAIKDLECPHSIERVDLELQPASYVMCLVWALGLEDQPGFRQLAIDKNMFPGGRFVSWLLEHGHLTQQPTISRGSLLLYFDGPIWRHACLGLPDGRVVSKWGGYLLLRHAVHEVPSDYGKAAQVYGHPGSGCAMELFRAFVEDCEKLPEWARHTWPTWCRCDEFASSFGCVFRVCPLTTKQQNDPPHQNHGLSRRQGRQAGARLQASARQHPAAEAREQASAVGQVG